MEQAIVSAVTHDVSEAKVTVLAVPDKPGIAALMFRSLADHDVNVDMIVQNVSAHGVTDISFTVPRDHVEIALRTCREHVEALGASEVIADDSIAKVSLVGAGMKSNPGVTATMFECLAGVGINIEMISTSAIRLTCVVDESRVEEAVQILHNAFEIDKPLITS